MKPDMDQRAVVLVCPCCASPVDAVANPIQQSLSCDACGQNWSMVVDADRIAEYALT